MTLGLIILSSVLPLIPFYMFPRLLEVRVLLANVIMMLSLAILCCPMTI